MEGGLKVFLVLGHIPVEILLLVNSFVDAIHIQPIVFLEDKQIYVGE